MNTNEIEQDRAEFNNIAADFFIKNSEHIQGWQQGRERDLRRMSDLCRKYNAEERSYQLKNGMSFKFVSSGESILTKGNNVAYRAENTYKDDLSEWLESEYDDGNDNGAEGVYLGDGVYM